MNKIGKTNYKAVVKTQNYYFETNKIFKTNIDPPKIISLKTSHE